MDNSPEIKQPLLLPSPEADSAPENPELTRQQRRITIIIIVVALLALILIVGSFVLLMQADEIVVAQMRDVFIIFMAFQSLLIISSCRLSRVGDMFFLLPFVNVNEDQ